jgi:hypothetical protein
VLTLAALVIPCGFLVVAGLALVLAVARVLYLPVFAVLLTGATSAMAWVGLARHGPGEYVAAWRMDFREHRWPYAVGGLFMVALIVIRLGYSPLLNLYSETPFRYWADGIEIADAHRIPAATLQWGQLVSPTVSKVALNAFHAAGTLVLGRGPLPPMGALLFVVSIGLVLGAVAFAREIGLRYTAPLFAMLLFLNRIAGGREMTRDLNAYRAENWGRLLMLVAVLLLVRAIRAEDRPEARREGILGAALLGMAGVTHLVPFVIGVTLVGGFFLAEVVFRHRFLPLLRRASMFAGVALIIVGSVLWAAGGDWGFEGVSARQSYQEISRELGLDESWDPTLFLARGVVDQEEVKPVRGFYLSPRTYYDALARTVTGRLPHRRFIREHLHYFIPAGLLVMFAFGSRRLRSVGIAAVALGVAIGAATLFFGYRNDLYALALFGLRRLDEYAMVPVVLVVLGVLEVAVVRGAGFVARFRGSPGGVARVTAVVLMVGLAAVMLPNSTSDSVGEEAAATALGPLAEASRVTPCSGRILGSARTLATYQVFTRRAGVLEGMGPFFRPNVLRVALRDMFAATEFFADPAGNHQFLAERGVATVVVFNFLGGATNRLEFDLAKLSAAPFLEEVSRSRSVVVFRVTDFDPSMAARFPDVTRQPGYLCGAA